MIAALSEWSHNSESEYILEDLWLETRIHRLQSVSFQHMIMIPVGSLRQSDEYALGSQTDHHLI